MARKTKTFTVVEDANGTRESGSVQIQGDLSREQLEELLANADEKCTYHVFEGAEIQWKCRQVVDLGAPVVRKPRAKKAEAVKPKPNGKPKISVEREGGKMEPVA